MTPSKTHYNQTYRNRTLWMIIALLIIRLIALKLSPYGLHGDEAQYWAWAQDLDWGYFSKPPMVAWIIALTTGGLGDAEWAARIASPIIHSGTAVLIFLTGRKAYSPQAGFWACAIYMLMPAVWVSSMIISTDVALLFFWALGLHAWVSLRQASSSGLSWRFAAQLGAALGLGLMSKYAMMFFLPPLIIACLFDAPTRKALVNIKGVAVILIAAVIITPNILWNNAHDFATLTHTASNTNLEGKTQFFHPLEFLQFFRDQLGVFGPIPFIILLITLATIRQTSLNATGLPIQPDKKIQQNRSPFSIYLALFTLTPLLIISLQAVLSRANANWAVSAYPSAALLLGAGALQFSRRKSWLNRGLFMQSLFCSFLLILSLFPSAVDKLGAVNPIKRLRAWPQTVEAIESTFMQGHDNHKFESIVLDNRLLFYDMQYYGLQKTAPIFIWQNKVAPNNHAQLTQPFIRQGAAPILLINYSENNQPAFNNRFTRIEPLDSIKINLGGGKTRSLKAWAGYGYTHPKPY